MTRRRLTPREKSEIIEEQGGMCFACSRPLDDGPDLGPTEWDHIIPLALGGPDIIENISAMHALCHRGAGGKTAGDLKRIAKAKRQERAMTEGRGRKRKGRPLQGRGFTGWRKFNGEIVRRG